MKKLLYQRGSDHLIRKLGLKMKLSLLILFSTFLSLQANDTYSQETRISLHMADVPVGRLLNELESTTEFRFVYRLKDVDLDRRVSIQVEKQTIETILNRIFMGTKTGYEIIDRQVFLLSRRNHGREKPIPLLAPNFSFRKMAPVPADTLRGEVLDESGAPLIGVNLQVKGTNKGTATDFEGRFELVNVDDNAVLVVSYIGYETQEVDVENRSNISIQMSVDAQTLDELVVVGYGTQKRATLTGSVADVAGKTLAKNPTTNLSNSLSGLLPGVITRSSSGEPGRDNALVLVRGRNTTGSTSPLIVVDGIQGYAGWQRINQKDIESISVLKDASAAIYGARAANGVILITTKRGIEGKPTINYSFNQGLSQPIRIPKMASSATFAEYINQLDVENGSDPRFSSQEIEKFKNGSDPDYRNTDWYDEVLKDFTPQSRHNLSIRGGAENLKYFFSGSFSNENSIFEKGSLNYKNYSLIGNFDFDINRYITLGLNINNIYEDGNYPTSSTSTTFSILKQIPFDPVYWENGLPTSGIDLDNPAVMATSIPGTVTDKDNRSTIKGSFKIKIPSVEGLSLNGYYAYTNNQGTRKDWDLPWKTYSYDKENNEYMGRFTGLSSPQLSELYHNSQRNLINVSLHYDIVVYDHIINTFIAAEQESGKYRDFRAKRLNFLSRSIDELFAGGLEDQSTSGVSSESGRKNLFGRVHYEYAAKYLLDFNYRYDGSSAFPEGQRFGFFPGLSVGWRLSEESFLNQYSNLDNLKLRASIGKIGNDAIAPFQYLRSYSLNDRGMPFGTSFSLQPGLIAGVEPNPNITWEVATLSNLGLEASFWSSKLGFELDVFKQKRENILTQRNLTIPEFTGFSLPVENIGSVENKGFEIQVNHENHIHSNFSYRIEGNFAFTRNKILDIDEATNVPEWQRREGKILGAELYYDALGIIRTQEELDQLPLYPGSQIGDLYYRDVNEDGKITGLDRVRTNQSDIPEITYGLNAGIDYQNFSLWINFGGASRFWNEFKIYASENLNNLEEILTNRWIPGSMDSKYPRLPTVSNHSEPSGIHSTFWLRDATYLKLRSLEISYQVPEKLLQRIGVRQLSVYMNGSNLLTFDTLDWADPEATGDRFNSYPQSKIFNVGINLSF